MGDDASAPRTPLPPGIPRTMTRRNIQELLLSHGKVRVGAGSYVRVQRSKGEVIGFRASPDGARKNEKFSKTLDAAMSFLAESATGVVSGNQRRTSSVPSLSQIEQRKHALKRALTARRRQRMTRKKRRRIRQQRNLGAKATELLLFEKVVEEWCSDAKKAESEAKALGFSVSHFNKRLHLIRSVMKHVHVFNFTTAIRLAATGSGITRKTAKAIVHQFVSNNDTAAGKFSKCFASKSGRQNALSRLGLEQKAREWVWDKCSKKKKVTTRSFRLFLNTELLNTYNIKIKSLDQTHKLLKYIGFSYKRKKKGVYIDGHNRPDVREYFEKVYAPRIKKTAERAPVRVPAHLAAVHAPQMWHPACARVVRPANHEIASPSIHPAAWTIKGVGADLPHVDLFVWKDKKNPNGLAREEINEVGGVLSLYHPEDADVNILVSQDESTIYANEEHSAAWGDETTQLCQAKSRGKGGMFSAYLTEQNSFPIVTDEKIERNRAFRAQQRLPCLNYENVATKFTKYGDELLPQHQVKGRRGKGKLLTPIPAVEWLEFGGAKWWDNDDTVKQLKRVDVALHVAYDELIHRLFGGRRAHFTYLFDWSTNHHAFEKGALVASKLNRGPSGGQPRMHDTVVSYNDLGVEHTLNPVEGGYFQRMVFEEGDVHFIEDRELGAGDPLIGQPKGAEQILIERGINTEDLVMNDKNDATRSMVAILSKHTDFKNEESVVEKAIGEMGGTCIFLPKFHAPCNAIEYIWGNWKFRARDIFDGSTALWRKTSWKELMATKLDFVRKSFRKARDFFRALDDGENAITMKQWVRNFKSKRHYTSHIRPPPSEYKE